MQSASDDPRALFLPLLGPDLVSGAGPFFGGRTKPYDLELAVGEVGPAAFHLGARWRRRVGVSHNAPYRHFREPSPQETSRLVDITLVTRVSRCARLLLSNHVSQEIYGVPVVFAE